MKVRRCATDAQNVKTVIVLGPLKLGYCMIQLAKAELFNKIMFCHFDFFSLDKMR
jgi:hypothetical protein